MRHGRRGRYLNRNAAHRRALFRNMACALLLSYSGEEGDEGKAKVPGRIITTVEKAKELRPQIEKLVTLAKKSRLAADAAAQFATSAARNTEEWKTWRKSDRWQQWNQAMAPAVDLRRRAFAALRDKQALKILFDIVAPMFTDRTGGYTRVVRLAEFRLGDAGRKALLEFVGKNDRVKTRRRAAPVVVDAPAETPAT